MEKLIEKTGTIYKCFKCNHIWDYQDDACPDCGGSFEDINYNLTIPMKTETAKEIHMRKALERE